MPYDIIRLFISNYLVLFELIISFSKQTLTKLDISNNQIGDRGVESLVDSLQDNNVSK